MTGRSKQVLGWYDVNSQRYKPRRATKQQQQNQNRAAVNFRGEKCQLEDRVKEFAKNI